MKILVLGGAGFLGVNIASSLVRDKHDVFIVDIKCSAVRDLNCLQEVRGFYDLDIVDPNAILRLVDEASIECVINLVSTIIPSSTLDAFFGDLASCGMPTFSLLPKLAEQGIKYIYLSSGGTIYGNNQSQLIPESTAGKPVNYYGYSKLIYEEYINLCQRSHGLDFLILRPSNPYGMHQNPRRMQGFIAVALNKLLNGECIEIWGDGSVIRDYIYVADMADALTSLISKNVRNAVFNIGTGIGHSILDTLSIMESVTGERAKIIYRDPRSVDVPRIVLDISRLQNEIDFRPRSLRAGIESYYKGLISNASQ